MDFRYRNIGSPGNTEPMTLGSPVGSPTKAASGQSYLPPYLFGESTSSPVASSIWNTPKPHHSNVVYQSPSTVLSPIVHVKEPVSYQSPVSSSMISSNPSKSGGPPVQGLIYSTPTHGISFNNSLQLGQSFAAGRQDLENLHHNSAFSPSKSYDANLSTYMSPAQIDPFFTQGEALKNAEQLDESWVTVFGFPFASSSYILQQFSQYGTIIEHKIPPKGNWMHLRYQSKLQAKKALSKNGKIFNNDIMIGVKPCIEMDLMESCKETSLQTSNVQAQDGREIQQTETPSKSGLKNIRPLTQAYQSPNLQTQASERSGSIISKAFDYLWKVH